MSFRLPVLMTVAATGLFAGAHALGKLNLQILPPPEVLGLSNAIAFLLTLLVILVRGDWATLKPRQPRFVLMRLVTALVETHGINHALLLLPLALFSTLISVLPLVAALLAWLFLGEKLSWRQIGLILLGFSGVVLAVQPDSLGGYAGVMYALSAAAAGACGVVIIRHVGTRESLQTLVLYTLGCVGIVNIALAVPVWVWPPLENWGYLIATGFFFYIGNLLITRAIQKAPTNVVAPLRYTTFIWATLYGWLFFHNLPSGATLAGIALIATSGILLVRKPAT